MKRVFVSLVFFASTLGAFGARADEVAIVSADQLFADGRRAADANDWPVACAKFARSYELEPSPGALLNLGDCEEHRDRLATAWRHFHKLADQLPDTDERKELATRRAAAVLARAPRLRVSRAHADTPCTVTRDGLVVAEATFGVAVPVDAGAHSLRVSAAGRKPAAYDLVLQDGELRNVEIDVGAVVAKDPPITAVITLPPPAPEPNAPVPRQRIAGWILVGAGATSFLVGLGFAGAALGAEGATKGLCVGSVCRDAGAVANHERAKTLALAADLMLGFGIALAATGVVLVLTAPRSRVAVSLAPWAGGLSLGGTF